MQCHACGTGGLHGKFCPECGTKLQVVVPKSTSVRPVGGTTGRVSSRVVSRTGSGVPGLSRPMTERGQQIKHAMDSLADEVYAPQHHTEQRPDQLQEAQSRMGGTYSHLEHAYTRISPQWRTGPLDQEGDLYQSSDRNILCMDVKDDLCVVGSTDHGLRVYDLKKKRETKNLFTKAYGHRDWVTSCAFLQDGRILSGAQDSKLCLWSKAGVRCTDLMGHTASISELKVNSNNIAVSCSYDRSLKIWNCAGNGACTGTLTGHKQAVMEFVWANTTIVSGDRGGEVRAWDAEAQTCLGVLKQGSGGRGQCSALGWYSQGDVNVVMAGDQTGHLKSWDLRVGSKPFSDIDLHPGGALTAIKSTSTHIITAGADMKLQVLDARLSHVHTITAHTDFIYSLATVGDLVLSGDGKGWLLVHDTHSGQCLYGLGANKAAVRCIKPSPSRLAVSGDDGSLVSYDF